MKKALALLLALVMCLSLVACGNSDEVPQTRNEASAETEAVGMPQMSKEEMLAIAESVNFSDIAVAVVENIARAQMDYCGKTWKVQGSIASIQTDHITLDGGMVKLDVYLPVEDIVNLENGLAIEVVGTLSDSFTSETEIQMGFETTTYYGEMRSAYFVNDRFEVSGSLFGANQSYAPAWNFLLPGSSVATLVYFSENQDTSALTYENSRANITFNARFINGNYKDAIIVSIG